MSTVIVTAGGIGGLVAATDARLEALLDAGILGWHHREAWRRQYRLDDSTGAVDLPGQSWLSRATVDRGDGRYLVNDQAAAPGLLSEVSWAAVVDAVANLHRASIPTRTGGRPDAPQVLLDDDRDRGR